MYYNHSKLLKEKPKPAYGWLKNKKVENTWELNLTKNAMILQLLTFFI